MSPSDLAERIVHRRAFEAVIWGMPVVNFDLMFQAMVREAKGAFNQIAYWSRLPDWKIQTLTPNPDAIYLTPFTNTAAVGAAREAHAWLVARYEMSLAPYYEGGHWARPGSRELIEGQATFFAKPDAYPVDVRGVTFSYAYFTPKHVGAGSSYLLTIADKDGRLLDGAVTYRLQVPPNAPVRQYWSATVYDRNTHAPIRNARWPSRSSQTPGLQKSADGSVDVYFAPKPPAGKESNWVPTSTEGGFEVLFRFYGPEKPLFEKTWRLPDIEKV